MKLSRGLLIKLKLTLPTLAILTGGLIFTQNLLTNPEENHHNIVYLTQSGVDSQGGQGIASDRLASTGMSAAHFVGLAAMLLIGAVLAVSRYRF